MKIEQLEPLELLLSNDNNKGGKWWSPFITLLNIFSLVIIIVMVTMTNDCIQAQPWPKTYFPAETTFPTCIRETYDKGYILGGWFELNGYPYQSYLLKTTINGDMLWSKRLSLGTDYTSLSDINQTFDNGFIISGNTAAYGSERHTFILKLNACGEKEWCRIYTSDGPNWESWGFSVYPVPGGYIMGVQGYGTDPDKRIWLFRLDNSGETIWQKVLAQNDTSIWGEDGQQLYITKNYDFIVSGDCYYPDPNVPYLSWLHPLLLKNDSSGNSTWESPLLQFNGDTTFGQGVHSLTDNQGMIYTTGRRIYRAGTASPGDKPALFRTTASGSLISCAVLAPDASVGETIPFSWLMDSTLVMGAGWGTLSDPKLGFFKTDKLGNILQTRILMTKIADISQQITTFDNKIVATTDHPLVGTSEKTTVFKVNSALEDDTLYNYPYVYDSLCPHAIPSNLILLDCIVVNIDEPFRQPDRLAMRVWPNPASAVVHIDLPDYLITLIKTRSFNVTTLHQQWGTATISIYNLDGKLMWQKEVKRQEKEIECTVEDWQNGLYMVKLTFAGVPVANIKVIVSH